MADWFAMILAAAIVLLAELAGGNAPVAITHVMVIDTGGGRAQADMTVVIEGERIATVGPAGSTKVPAGAQVVDGAGKFLIPGLWDMHIHTFFGDWVPGGSEVTLPLFIANGVTGVRDMGSDLDPILKAREDVAQGGWSVRAWSSRGPCWTGRSRSSRPRLRSPRPRMGGGP